MKFNKETAAVHTDRSIWRYAEYFAYGRRWGPSVLDRYIFMEILIPFVVALLFLTTLFITLILKDMLGELLGKGIEPLKLIGYIGTLIGEKITETIPFASLFAGILAAGRLSGDSEIQAMRSAGISFPRIYVVFLFFGTIASVLVLFMNFYYGPLSSQSRESFEDWLKSYHSLSLVKPGRFLGTSGMDGASSRGQDIYTESRLDNQLHNVQIREWFNNVDPAKSETITVRNIKIPIGDGFITQIIHAERGEMLSREVSGNEEHEKFIRFHKGFIVEMDEKQSGYQVTGFREGFMDYVLPPPLKPIGKINVRPENYTFPELFVFIEKLQKGEHEVDPCQLNPAFAGCSGASKSGTVKLTGGMGGQNIPSKGEMQRSILETQMWLAKNFSLKGKPGGPSSEEFQLRTQIMLQYTALLKDTEKVERKFKVEIQRRMATPVACLLFFFISFPLGLVVKRSGKGMSFSMAVIVFALYYTILLFGLGRAYKGTLEPWVGAWSGNILIAVMSVYIMSKRTEGFSPFRFIWLPFVSTHRFILSPIARVMLRVPIISRLYLYSAKIYKRFDDALFAFKERLKEIVYKLFRKVRPPSGD